MKIHFKHLSLLLLATLSMYSQSVLYNQDEIEQMKSNLPNNNAGRYKTHQNFLDSDAEQARIAAQEKYKKAAAQVQDENARIAELEAELQKTVQKKEAAQRAADTLALGITAGAGALGAYAYKKNQAQKQQEAAEQKTHQEYADYTKEASKIQKQAENNRRAIDEAFPQRKTKDESLFGDMFDEFKHQDLTRLGEETRAARKPNSSLVDQLEDNETLTGKMFDESNFHLNEPSNDFAVTNYNENNKRNEYASQEEGDELPFYDDEK